MKINENIRDFLYYPGGIWFCLYEFICQTGGGDLPAIEKSFFFGIWSPFFCLCCHEKRSI